MSPVVFAQITEHAREQLFPFWAEFGTDKVRGGFKAVVGPAGENLAPEGDKGLVQHARLLWSFSRAYEVFQEKFYLDLAKYAYDYLLNCFLDRKHGGFFYHVDPYGAPADARKHVYGQAFTIYGLAHYGRVSGDGLAIKLSQSIAELLKEKARDKVTGGYHECFDRTWSPVSQMSEYGANGREKTMNAHIHLLEAYTELTKVCPAVVPELNHLIDVILDKVYLPGKATLGEFFSPDWKQVRGHSSFGHDIETSWLLKKATSLTDHRKSEVQLCSFRLAENVCQQGLKTYCHNSPSDQRSIWWVQAEALVGLAWAGKWKEVENLWDWIKQHHILAVGEWSELAGAPQMPIGHLWKTCYHNGRACLELLEMGM